MELPAFRYHLDPVGTGSLVRSDGTCRVCRRARGYIYTGPVRADTDLDQAICPWCIADGSAASQFDAEFTDPDAVGDYGAWGTVPDSVRDEVSRRTPGFNGWQQERWWVHCGDAAAYLGPAGHAELSGQWRDAVPAIRAETKMDAPAWAEYFPLLRRGGDPQAYVFRCRHCAALGGYSDAL